LQEWAQSSPEFFQLADDDANVKRDGTSGIYTSSQSRISIDASSSFSGTPDFRGGSNHVRCLPLSPTSGRKAFTTDNAIEFEIAATQKEIQELDEHLKVRRAGSRPRQRLVASEATVSLETTTIVLIISFYGRLPRDW